MTKVKAQTATKAAKKESTAVVAKAASKQDRLIGLSSEISPRQPRRSIKAC